MPKVKFVREKVEIDVPEGANLRQEALKAGIAIYPGVNRILNCRGFSACGSCRVLIGDESLEAVSTMGFREKFRLKLSWVQIGHEKNMRLACQTNVRGDVEVTTQPQFNLYGKQKSW